MARLIRGGFDVRDVAHRRIGPAKTGNWRVEIAPVQQVHAALVLIVRGQAKQFPRIRFQTKRRLDHVRDLKVGIGLYAARWQDRLRSAAERIRKRGAYKPIRSE